MAEPCARCVRCHKRPRVKICVPVDTAHPNQRYKRDLRTYLQDVHTAIYCLSCAALERVGVQIPEPEYLDAYRDYWRDRIKGKTR
jgi:Rad3-related DNA helicase